MVWQLSAPELLSMESEQVLLGRTLRGLTRKAFDWNLLNSQTFLFIYSPTDGHLAVCNVPMSVTSLILIPIAKDSAAWIAGLLAWFSSHASAPHCPPLT